MTEQEIIGLVASSLGADISNISIESSISNTPEWDSISHFTLLASLSTIASVDIPIDQYPSLTSVRTIHEFITKSI